MHPRRVAPLPPSLNQSTNLSSNHQQVNNIGRSISPSMGSSTNGSGSNRSLSPRPLSPTSSSNTSEEEIITNNNKTSSSNSKQSLLLNSIASSSNFSSQYSQEQQQQQQQQYSNSIQYETSSSLTTPSPVNPDITAFSDYDISPSLSSIASSQKSTGSVETATILTRLSTVSTPTMVSHPFGVVISPIKEEIGNGNGNDDEEVGEDSTVSGFELVDDLPKEGNRKILSSNSLKRNIGENGELLSANRWNGLDDRPDIQQSDSYNSFNSSSGWKTDSSADSPITAIQNTFGPQTRKVSNAPWEESVGPKARKISKAPWEDEDNDADSILSVSSYAPSMKENAKVAVVKPKSTLRSRSRSFSALAIRRGHSEVVEVNQVSSDPLQGLGLGSDLNNNNSTGGGEVLPSKLSRSPKGVKDRLTASRGDSILIIGNDIPTKSWEPIMIRKGSSSSSTESAVQYQSQQQSSSISSPLLEPNISTSMNRTPPSRDRGLQPLVFDKNSNPTLLHPATPPVPHSAPAYTTSFNQQDESVLVGPRSFSAASNYSRSLHSTSPTNPSFPTSTAGISAPFSAVMGYDGTALTSNVGPGYKLISLEMARQRETDRIAIAAAQRKAQLPVENRPETTYSTISTVNNVNVGGSRKSSYNKDEPSTSSPPHPTLKTKRSGFLKRMLGGGDKTTVVPPLPTSNFPPAQMESEETYRITTNDNTQYDYIPTPKKGLLVPHSNATPITITIATPLPSLNSTSTFTSSSSFNPLDQDDFEFKNNNNNNGLAPSLSLRPVSMGFLAGLPTDFLAKPTTSESKTNSNTSTYTNTNDDLDTPRIQSSYSNAVIPPSTSFPFLQHKHSSDDQENGTNSHSPTSSAATTPLTPRFSPNSNTSSYSNPTPPLISNTKSMYEVKSTPLNVVTPPPSKGLETFSELETRFHLAQLEWKGIQLEYEVQIKELKLQLENFISLNNRNGNEKSGNDKRVENECIKCQQQKCICIVIPVGVLSRPRFIGNGGEGALFSG